MKLKSIKELTKDLKEVKFDYQDITKEVDNSDWNILEEYDGWRFEIEKLYYQGNKNYLAIGTLINLDVFNEEIYRIKNAYCQFKLNFSKDEDPLDIYTFLENVVDEYEDGITEDFEIIGDANVFKETIVDLLTSDTETIPKDLAELICEAFIEKYKDRIRGA